MIVNPNAQPGVAPFGGVALPGLGVAAATANAVEGELLEMVIESLTKQIADDALPYLWKRLGIDDGMEWSGTNLRFPVDFRRDSSDYVTRPDGPILEGDHPDLTLASVSAIFRATELSFTDDTVWSDTSSATRLVKLLAFKIQKLQAGLKTGLGRESYLDSSGTLSTVSTEAAGVITPTENYNHMCFIDQKVEVWTVSGANWATHKGDVYITSLGRTGTPTITVSGTRRGTAGAGYTFSFAANDRLVRRGAAVAGAAIIGSSMNGMDVFADDGDVASVFEGMDSSVYPEWRALRIDAAGGAAGFGDLTIPLFYQITKGRDQLSGGDSRANLMITNQAVLISAKQIFQPTLRMSPGGQVVIGFPSVAVSTGSDGGVMEIVEDPTCPTDRLFCLDTRHIKYARKQKLHWRPATRGADGSAAGGGQFVKRSDRLRYQGEMVMAGNLLTDRRNAQAQIENIRTTQHYDVFFTP